MTEIPGGGSVRELCLVNTAELPVLLVDGEEMMGAKQNRVLNLTILAPAKHTTVIPVSCVEAGRWSMANSDLTPTAQFMYSKVRAQRVSQVTHSMHSSGSRRSDQSAVWDGISEKSARLNVSSPTRAMSAIYERHAHSVEEFVRAFTWQDGQCGIIFVIGNCVLGMDVFDYPEVMGRFFHKLVRSYALDALDTGLQGTGLASVDALTGFVTQFAAVRSFANQALGIGKDVRFSAPGICGAALWAQERYVHICIFAMPEGDKAGNLPSRMSRPTHRRMF